jgi:hypothetical protein
MLAYLFIVAAVASRLLPHPFAFTPVGASLLFFGAQAPRKHAWIPLVLLAGSDVYLTLFRYDYPFAWDTFVTWAWYAAMLMLGSTLRNNARPLRVLGASIVAAVSFFVVSNFAVWAAMDMYPKTLAGLMSAYVYAIPFFRTEVVANVLFAAIMFGIPAMANVFGGNEAHQSAKI